MTPKAKRKTKLNPKRINSTLKRLKQYWESNSNKRLGEILLELADDIELYYLEDNTLVERINQWLEEKQEKVTPQEK